MELQIYYQLTKHIKFEYIKYGFEPSVNIRCLPLTACIVLYHNIDPNKIITAFEENRNMYDVYKVNKNLNEIEFQCFDHIQMQFLLRYVIGYKLKELDINNGLNIIVGYLKDFVRYELLEFNPPIKCKYDQVNDSMLIISKDELLPYLNDENINYAKNKLINASDDWYLYDLKYHPIFKDVMQFENKQNELMKQHATISVIHTMRNKQVSNTENRLYPKTTENQNIRNSIQDAKSVKRIMQILDERSNDIIDESVYSKALQKCNALHNRDYRVINKIMDMMLLNFNVKYSIVVFNIFFNSMSFCDEPLKCIEFVDFVINGKKSNGIIPDKTTFPVLLKSVRKQGLYKFADRYLKIMKGKFNMKPCLVTYTEMLCVYSRSYQNYKAIQLFEEYRQRDDLDQQNETIHGAYLNVFSRMGDIKEMENVIHMMKNKNISMTNPVILSDIMRTYVVAGKPRKCIKIYNYIINNKNIEIQPSHLSLTNIAMTQLIHCETVSEQEKYQLFDDINDILDNKFAAYGYKVSPVDIVPLFDAAIGLYCNKEPIKIINLFEKLLNKQLIGYTTFDGVNGDNALDLHGFYPPTAQFILRYVFVFKLNELLLTMDESNDFIIITGKGKHTSKKKGILKQIVMDELLSFDPPMKFKNMAKDTG
eukprot:290628_1